MRSQTFLVALSGSAAERHRLRGETVLAIDSVEGRPQRVLRGVSLIVAAMFVTSVQDVVFKIFSDRLSLGQIFTLRALLAFPLLLALAWAQGLGRGGLADALRTWPLLRAFFMALMFLAFYAAIPFVNLSVLGAGTYTAPILVTLLSAYLIGEAVGRRGWIAVLVGFAGVVILLRPGTDAFSLWGLLPVIGAAFYAVAHVTTRWKCQSVPIAAMALSVNMVMLAAGLAVSGALWFWQPDDALVRSYPYLFSGWSPLGAREWLVLGVLALLTVVISAGIAGAYQAAPPPLVATFEYSYLVFVALWDSLFFAASPGGSTILGMLLIIAAGLLVLRRR